MGGDGDDSLNGSDAGELLDGGGGRDTIFGAAGNDTVSGGDGVDYLRGDEGADSIVGGAGFDDINGNMGDDVASGGDGEDWVVGGKDNDLLFGGAGGDIVYGNLGNDTCDGGDGADLIRGGQGDDVLRGGADADYVSGDRGDDTISGGAGADIFHTFGEAGIDRALDFNPAEGDRVLFEPDTLYSVREVGGDTVVEMVGGGVLTLVGVRMADLPTNWASGGTSQDPAPTVRTGTADDDELVGSSGSDSIVGLGGDDLIEGRDGADTLDGGAGRDTLRSGPGGDVLFGGDDQDLLEIYFSTARAVGGAGDDSFFIRAATVNEPVRLALVEGGTGSDTLQLRTPLQANQRLVFDGGVGVDQIVFTPPSEATTIDVFLGQDPGGAGLVGRGVEIALINSAGRIFGGDADEYLSLLSGQISGGGGNDELSAQFSRGDGATLSGGAGDDVIHGGSGVDVISGGAGDDTLTGGRGPDRFEVTTGAGTDKIVDFSISQGDRLYVLGGANFVARQDGADTVVEIAGGRVVLVGVDFASLPDGWIFAVG